MICDLERGAIVRVDAVSGSKSVVMPGLAYSNGLEVDAENRVYAAEQHAGRDQNRTQPQRVDQRHS